MRPALIERRFSRRSLRAANRAASACAAILLVCASNTPVRVDAYAAAIPGLGFLAGNPSVMFEYGFLHDDPEVGVFRSRFDPAGLREQDEGRATEVATVLDAYRGDEAYRRFLQDYSAARDPFAHEAGVHLFRRDRYLVYRDRNRADPVEFAKLSTVVFRENLLLEKYFGRTLETTSQTLSADLRAELERDQQPDLAYESSVSIDLVTLPEWRVRGSLLALLALLFGLDRFALRQGDR